MARKKTTSENDEVVVEPSLELAMGELSQIVQKLESGQESLDESLARFERGMTLLRVCHRRLDEASQRIEIVTRAGASGEPETQPFDGRATLQKDATATAGGNSKRPAGEDDDTGFLF
ncbi:MAG: exodeoxyribonuclease VII small subunit [Planctomycetia bacterium]